MSSKTIINLITVIAVLIVVYFGYQYFTGSTATPDATGGVSVIAIGDSGGAINATNSPADEFRQLLASISSVDFQGDHPIFTNQTFTSALEDFSQPLPLIDSSRVNPFAPLDKSALSARHPATTSPSVSPASRAITATTTATTTTSRPTPTATPTPSH